MFKHCVICGKGFHTPCPTKKTCGRINCVEIYRRINGLNKIKERRITKFRSDKERKHNIARVEEAARQMNMSYGEYMACKERGWTTRNRYNSHAPLL